MRRLLALPIALAACSFSGSGMPTDAGTDMRPPDPVDAMPDAPDGAPDVDSDGDQVDDDTDNCAAMANPDQHDEDGDLQGDVCDACPTIANQGTGNADGDALPDACDANPSIAGDTIKVFLPFSTGAALPTNWVLFAGDLGNWSITNDTLRVAAGDATEIAGLKVDVANQVLEVGFDIVSAPSGQRFFTTLVNVKADGTEFVGCGVRLDGAPKRELFDYDVTRPTAMRFDELTAIAGDPPMIANGYRMTLHSQAATQTCRSVGGTSTTVHTLSGSVTRRPNQHVGLRARNATIAIRYVVVYHYP